MIQRYNESEERWSLTGLGAELLARSGPAQRRADQTEVRRREFDGELFVEIDVDCLVAMGERGCPTA
ncbi:MAG TPA: hypothetical protein VGD50_02345 [Candidatus Baltobacteraceae bacterium]